MSETTTRSGMGIGSLIFVALLVGKLAGVINLSWFVVLTSIVWAPLFATGIIFLTLFVVGGLILGGAAGVSAISDSRRKRKMLK